LAEKLMFNLEIEILKFSQYQNPLKIFFKQNLQILNFNSTI